MLESNPYFQKYLDTIRYHHQWQAEWHKNHKAADKAHLYRRIVTIADTIDSKALRPDIKHQEVVGIIREMCDEDRLQKFDRELVKKISLPSIELGQPAWKESKEYVLGIVEQRGYLKMFDYDYH